MSNYVVNKKDIAVIGMSGKFPLSDDLYAFWEHLKAGDELIHFYRKDELQAAGFPQSLTDDPLYIKAKSFIRDKDAFDPSFFGYTLSEARMMDPQIRLFHEYVWKALEDAGYDPFSYGGKIGLFGVAGDNLNWMAHAMVQRNKGGEFSFMDDKVANRLFLNTLISYKLNLRGPAYFINTACSSSLSIIHVACRNLLMRECTIALAGGINIDTSTAKGYPYREGMISSADGHCKTFDAGATGTIGGEGVGVVVLKLMEDAIRDNDQIYAVIRGSAVNNDGNRKIGYTAPSVEGQAECIRMAHKIAGVSPASISYVEAHGTATRLGDPIEVEALNLAFEGSGAQHCALGSVKSNMGHLDNAAGIAGFIKTVLALKHKLLPPSLHYTKPNPEIRFNEGPFFVNDSLREWKTDGLTPRRAGVSSFGIGGTNAHVVLEEAPEAIRNYSVSGRRYHLLLQSARSSRSLDGNIQQLDQFLQRSPVPAWSDVAFTLQVRRAVFPFRSYRVAGDPITDTPVKAQAVVKRKIVFLFPGQGAQYQGMGEELYSSEPFFRKEIDKGLEMLAQLTGESYKNILLKGALADKDGLINQTLHTQPLLFVFEHALARLLMHWGIQPDLMIGHSVGEYVAACISGVYSFSDALQIMVKRAQLLNGTETGAMASVNRSASDIKASLPAGIAVAAINAPGSCVISGHNELMEPLLEQFRNEGCACIRLKTSHAFHSAMVDPVLDEFRQYVAQYGQAVVGIPFVSNVDGKLLAGGTKLPDDYWASHLRGTVLFAAGVETILKAHPATLFIEVGPGNALTSFINQIKGGQYNDSYAVSLIKHIREEIPGDKHFFRKIGELWINGVNLNWAHFYENENRQVLSLPTYAFEQHRFLAEVDFLTEVKELLGAGNITTGRFRVEDMFYVPGWKTSLLEQRTTIGSGRILLFSDESGLAAKLSAALRETGKQVITVLRGSSFQLQDNGNLVINPAAEDDLSRLFSQLNGFIPEQLIYMWSENETPAAAFQLLTGIYRRLHLNEYIGNGKFWFISQELERVLGNENVTSGGAVITGFLKVLSQERAGLFCGHIDVPVADSSDALVTKVLAELTGNEQDQQIAFRHGQRWIRVYDNTKLSAGINYTALRQKGVYLITGGLGKLGYTLAAYLLKKYEATVVLTGRTILNADELEKNERYAALQALKGKVVYYAADVNNYQALAEAVCTAEQHYGPINGVIHAAGNTAPAGYQLLERTTTAQISAHFDPKIGGVKNLYALFSDKAPDFVCLISSISGILGGLTYSAYAAANIFLDYFLEEHTGLTNWCGINLDGLSLDPQGKRDSGINPEELVQIFELVLHNRQSRRYIVSVSDLHQRIQKHVQYKSLNLTTPDSTEQVIGRPALTTVYVSPDNELQQQLADMWCSFFGMNRIGINDEFFELGGDSLKAMTLCQKIHKEFHVEISVNEFFQHTTIASLAAILDANLKMAAVRSAISDNNNVMEVVL